MTTTTADSLLAALRWRYATKSFDPSRRIPGDLWEALEQSLVLTPSSFGLQPWKFIVVEDRALREKLRADSWDQPQVTDASHFVVLTARTDLAAADVDRWIARSADVQGRPAAEFDQLKGMIAGFAEKMSDDERHAWNTRQVYIALGQLLTAAALLGIDACPMEGISAGGYDRVLGLENSGYATAVACALGYRAADDKYATIPKARFPLDQVVSRK